MSTTKEILQTAQTDIDSAIGIVEQAMRVVQTLADNGHGDSELAEYFLMVSAGLVDAMRYSASEAVQKIHRQEVKRDLTILKGELAGIIRSIRMGQ